MSKPKFRVVEFEGEYRLIPVSEDPIKSLRENTKSLREDDRSPREMIQDARDAIAEQARR